MDVKNLYTLEAHEDGAEIQIKSPADNEPTDFYIKVKGVDSKAYREAVRKYHRKLLNDEEGGEIDLEKSLGVGYKQKTIFGGFLAILAWLLFLGEFGLTLNKLYWQRDSLYTMNDIFIPEEELGETIVNLD